MPFMNPGHQGHPGTAQVWAPGLEPAGDHRVWLGLAMGSAFLEFAGTRGMLPWSHSESKIRPSHRSFISGTLWGQPAPQLPGTWLSHWASHTLTRGLSDCCGQRMPADSGETWLRAKPLIIGVKTLLGERCDSLHIKKNTQRLKSVQYIEIYVLIMTFSNLFVTFGRYERLTISFERLIKEKIQSIIC